MLYNFVADFL